MYSDLAVLEEDLEKLVPALTHIWNAVDATQASNMKHSHGNEGIHILLVVIYASDDQAARQASAIIMGDSFAQDIVRENIVDVQKVLNGVVDSVWCVSSYLSCFDSLISFAYRARKAF